MWDLRLQPDELRAADTALSSLRGCNFFTISLGGKDRAKDWGDGSWSALLQLMNFRFGNIGLVFVGSRDEFERCNSVAGCWSGPKVNLCGRLTPRESAAVMRRALFYLGHDCGPMHLAAAVGIPCVALFGSFNMPKSWHPMGATHRVIHNMQGIAEIAPEEVLAAVDATISEIPAWSLSELAPDQGVLSSHAIQNATAVDK
jgi:ADP-heptose:LPS heptosyltransferase